MAYNGYLLPYVSLIKHLHSQGMSGPQISRHLYDAGVRATWGSWSGIDEDNIRSMAGCVNYVIRGPKKKLTPKPVEPVPKVTKIVLDWQTWTPEMQEAEFLSSYSR